MSCNCWPLVNGGYKPMDFVPTGEGAVAKAVEIYKKPVSHNPDRPPFHPDIDWNEYRIVEVQ